MSSSVANGCVRVFSVLEKHCSNRANVMRVAIAATIGVSLAIFGCGFAMLAEAGKAGMN